MSTLGTNILKVAQDLATRYPISATHSRNDWEQDDWDNSWGQDWDNDWAGIHENEPSWDNDWASEPDWDNDWAEIHNDD